MLAKLVLTLIYLAPLTLQQDQGADVHSSNIDFWKVSICNMFSEAIAVTVEKLSFENRAN